jgi:transcriptional regulator with XRE-family HTH domain
MTTPALNPARTANLPPGREIARQRLGTNLRNLRENCGALLEDASATLGVAPSTLSRIETGKAPTRAGYLNLLLDFYQVTDPDRRRELTDLARQGQRDTCWNDAADLLPRSEGRYLGLEEAADRARAFATQLIPGPLQEPGYTTAAIRATRPELNPAQVRALATLTGRRQVLRRDGFRLHAILDETVLHRPPATATVMAAQLTHLTSLTASTTVTIQVLPLTTPWPVISPPFTLLAFPDPDDPETASTLSHSGQHQLTTSRNHVGALTATFTKLSRAALPAHTSADLIADLAHHSASRPARAYIALKHLRNSSGPNVPPCEPDDLGRR